jgi:hypothetical protein
MDKNQKMWLIGGGIAALGLLTYVVVSKKNTSTLPPDTRIGGTGTCPAGQVPCSNNRLKCYDPMANYLVNPCTATTNTTNPTKPTIQNPIATPIAEIVDGIIGLFKKKPATA